MDNSKMELNTTATTSAAECPIQSSEHKFVAACNNNEQFSVIRIPEDGEKSSKHSSKKQSKRRKKSSNHTRPLPRIIVKPLLPPPPTENREWTAASCMSYSESSTSKPSTMREVLASIPGFSLKPRKRSGKKLSTAAQLQQTREGSIDLESPDSILVNTNIRQLLNKHTFSLLPPLYQYKLGQLLPSVERLSPSGRLNPSSLNNEFFSRACLEWQNCLSGGEFTPENQQKMKSEAEKEKSKIDPWKLKHFEPIWGEKSRKEKSSLSLNTERPSLKTTIKLRPTASITSSSTVPKIKKSKSSNSKRMRSVGAVTRASSKAEDVIDESLTISVKSSPPVPDLLPLKHAKQQGQTYEEEYQVDYNFSDTSSTQQMDDSVTTTPVDPLLLPEGESESNETKQELDITIVTIEESNALKDCDGDKAIDSDSNLNEAYKRMSDDSESYSYAKRIKFQEEDDLENSSYLLHTTEINSYSYVDTTCENEHVVSHEIYSESIDTNSQEEKVHRVHDYNERTEPESNLKVDNHIIVSESSNTEPIHKNEIILETDGDVNIKKSPVQEVHNEYMLFQDSIQTEVDKKEIENEDPENNKTIQTYEVKECEESEPTHEFPQVPSAVKCEEKERIPQSVTQNYYDERFKDAESFILETGLSSILASGNTETNIFTCVNHTEIFII